MGRPRSTPQYAFWITALLTLVPLLLFPFRSAFAHSLYRSPQIQNGVLDLSDYDLTRQRPIPLDGQWERIQGRWLITESADTPAESTMSSVPQPQHTDSPLSKGGSGSAIATYRLTLINCPGETALLCYIPNTCSQYRVFLNGALIAQHGLSDKSAVLSRPHQWRYTSPRQSIVVPEGSTAELVIELYNPYVGGMYMTPILTEQNRSHNETDLRSLIFSACISIIAVSIIFIACLLVLRDDLLSSSSLLVMDLLVFIRLLCENGYLLFSARSYLLSAFLQVVTLFLPVVFLFCVRKLIHSQISNRSILRTALFELILAPIIFFLALNGRLGLSQILCVASYFPFIYIIRLLYQSVKRKAPYSLLVSMVIMLVLSSMIAASQSFSGWLVLRNDLFPPICFTIAMLLQLWIAMQHNLDIQKQMAEAKNLRLQLRESELNLRLSQIKPHFLYNTLLAIHMLCTVAPETAAEATLKFATFLRTNMNFIDSRELIPFEQELTHIQNYTDIEQLRFQRRLTIHYDIKTTAFFVPPLSIQPLVENAIRHGACKNLQGGTVTISTWESPAGFEVEIRDDGPGFDPDTVLNSAHSTHGLSNILFRLWEQQHAQVDIQSAPGKGTCVLISLSKEGTS